MRCLNDQPVSTVMTCATEEIYPTYKTSLGRIYTPTIAENPLFYNATANIGWQLSS